jgi:CRP-like cAMP-binding protein
MVVFLLLKFPTFHYFYCLVGGALKLYFEEDLFPGEVFGETALSGMHTRLITAQAITNVDLAVIDDSDFVLAQDRDSMHMGTEERVLFLKQIPMFKLWDNYKLMRLAVALVQEEINKNVILIQKGNVCKDFYLLVNGRIDIIDHIEKKNVVTSLLKYDYLGESGIINKFVKATSSKVVEDHFAMAVTRVDVLILHESNFFIFDLPNIEVIRKAFTAKTSWRKDRLIKMKHERAKVRSYKKIMSKEFDSNSFGEENKVLNSFNTTKEDHLVTDYQSSSLRIAQTQSSLRLPLMDCNNSTNCLDYVGGCVEFNNFQKTRPVQSSKMRTSEKDSKLLDLEDIPQIFMEGFDPFMITTSIKNRVLLEKVQDAMVLGRRPKSARLLIASADGRRHVGFSGGKPRPYSAVPKTNVNCSEMEGMYETNIESQSHLFLRGSYRIPSSISYSTVERNDH